MDIPPIKIINVKIESKEEKKKRTRKVTNDNWEYENISFEEEKIWVSGL